MALLKTLLVSLDDLLAVVQELLNPHVSRSGLDRCLRRHGVGNLRDLKVKEAKPKRSVFMAYKPGYLHIDVKYLPHPLGTFSWEIPCRAVNGGSDITPVPVCRHPLPEKGPRHAVGVHWYL